MIDFLVGELEGIRKCQAVFADTVWSHYLVILKNEFLTLNIKNSLHSMQHKLSH